MTLQQPLERTPPALANWNLGLTDDGETLVFAFKDETERARIAQLLREVGQAGVEFRDLETQQSSLEEIFVSLVRSAK